MRSIIKEIVAQIHSNIFNYITRRIICAKKYFLGGGVILGGGDILVGEAVLSEGDIIYFLCFISRFGRPIQFGWQRLFG